MMETTVNPGMCRCCASEGAFKDIKSIYHWMGEEEIYADMLRDCFDIILNVSEQIDDGGICEVCITQLRNAINFKKQVLHTEDQFQKHLQNKTLFRPNIVKVEVQGEDDSDNIIASGDEGFSGAEYEVPIKKEVDDPKPKKRAAKATATTTRASAKKAKADNGETSSKREKRNTPIEEDNLTTGEPVVSTELKPEKPRSATKRKSDDLKTILQFSNATLIRNKDGDGYCCNFCPKKFEHPKNLKIHSLEDHADIQALRMPKSFEYVIKLDITDLECKICKKTLKKLDDFSAHLKTDHSKNITTDMSEIIPFKFDTEELHCAICGSEYSTFKILQEHMHHHFRNHICEICSAGFITRRLLICHKRRHAKGEFKCSTCDKIFISEQKRRDHVQRIHLGLKKRNICKVCGEKFKDYWTKMHHRVQIHGAPPISIKCSACERSFTDRRSLMRHVKKDHLMERQHDCSLCDMKFFLKQHLVEHMRVHTGIMKFQCHVCKKHYATKNSLNQHLPSHADHRKFACTVCGQGFVQERTLNNHLKAKHGE